MKSILWRLFLIAPILFAAGWTTFPAAKTALAIYNAYGSHDVPRWAGESGRSLERRVQRHFLDHKVYIPLEDIVRSEELTDAPKRVAQQVRQVCGKGTLFVWLPFRFRIPVYGDKVYEWCWKPKSQQP